MPKDAQWVVTSDDAKAEVVFTASPEDAELAQAGKLDLAVAFMQGRVKAAGDGRALLALLKNSR
ncbi:MAG TPA: SCP2 sterol-binding domain-containing protein [Acidimicrobiales bacterium]|nr:SCP2 sterol-binding domain-containing protein [Acidimicrobiales bacterium]